MLETFLITNPRNKLVLSKDELSGFKYIDMGYELSNVLVGKEGDSRISLIAFDAFKKLVEETISTDKKYGQYIGIKNIGILFEPQLEFNIRSIFESLSRECLLLIQFDGEVTKNEIYFITQQSGKRIDLTGISYKTINL